MYGGQEVIAGNIILRQRGTRVRAGEGVQLSKDFSIIALKKGTVKFIQRNGQQYVTVV